MKKNIGIIIFIIVIALGSLFIGKIFSSKTNNAPTNISAQKITVFQSPTCGCCGNYVAYLRKKGYEVESVKEPNMDSIKTKYNIPDSLVSCHTSVVGKYVVEGHVPVEVIEDLLGQKPNIAGIALAGMPSGSPGMPGTKFGPFEVHSINLDGSDGGIFENF